MKCQKKHAAGPAMIISKNYLTTSQTKMIKMFPTSRRTLWPNRICQRCFENGCFFHREQWQIKQYFLAFEIGAVLAESGAGPTQMSSTVLVLWSIGARYQYQVRVSVHLIPGKQTGGLYYWQCQYSLERESVDWLLNFVNKL